MIKIIIKIAFQQQQIELMTRKPDNRFVLKVYGSEDYLYGSTSLMKYEYVRKCLRSKEPVRLQLTEKMFSDSNGFRLTVFERNRRDVDQGIYKEIKWSGIRNEEPFLWYPPYRLSQEYIQELRDKGLYQRKYRE